MNIVPKRKNNYIHFHFNVDANRTIKLLIKNQLSNNTGINCHLTPVCAVTCMF